MNILCLESSGPVCSAAIFDNSTLLGIHETQEPYAHSSYLAGFVEELVQAHGQPDAVAVSSGPGSYTGLRIGVSLAKGLCSGWQVPLIAVSTLSAMVEGFIAIHGERNHYIPCLDARRMEVYTAGFDSNGLQTENTRALVVENNESFEREGEKTLFGDGADKLTELLANRTDIEIIPNFLPSARFMGTIAMTKFAQQEFEDVAYFEPYYLKEFIALKPKKR